MRKIMIAILVSLFAMGAYATNPATATATATAITKQANYQQTTSQNNWLAGKRVKSKGKKKAKKKGKAKKNKGRR